MDLEWFSRLWTEQFTIPASRSVALLVAGAVLLLGEVAYRSVFATLKRFTGVTATPLDDRLLARMRLPARLLLILVTLHTLLLMRGAQYPVVSTTVMIIELLLAAHLLIEAFETLFIHYWLEERRQIQVPAVIRHLILVVLYTVAVLSILGSVAGVNVVPVLATSTVVTVVLGLALQDTLGNLFAGLALHVEKPFDLGDWIMVDGLEGRVIYAGWRSTRLRTFSGDVVALPNSTIAKARIQNFYAPDPRTVRLVDFPVSLAASPEVVEQAAMRAIGQVQGVLVDPAPKVWLVGITPLYQRYIARIWIEDFAQHDEIESNLMKALWRECQAEGVLPRETSALMAVEPPAGTFPPFRRPS